MVTITNKLVFSATTVNKPSVNGATMMFDPGKSKQDGAMKIILMLRENRRKEEIVDSKTAV